MEYSRWLWITLDAFPLNSPWHVFSLGSEIDLKVKFLCVLVMLGYSSGILKDGPTTAPRPWWSGHHERECLYSRYSWLWQVVFSLKSLSQELNRAAMRSTHVWNTVKVQRKKLKAPQPVQLTAPRGKVCISFRPEATAVHSTATWWGAVRQGGGCTLSSKQTHACRRVKKKKNTM